MSAIAAHVACGELPSDDDFQPLYSTYDLRLDRSLARSACINRYLDRSPSPSLQSFATLTAAARYASIACYIPSRFSFYRIPFSEKKRSRPSRPSRPNLNRTGHILKPGKPSSVDQSRPNMMQQSSALLAANQAGKLQSSLLTCTPVARRHRSASGDLIPWLPIKDARGSEPIKSV